LNTQITTNPFQRCTLSHSSWMDNCQIDQRKYIREYIEYHR
jgi:hypothetical protein